MHVSVRHLSKSFGRLAALQDVSLDIPEGEIVAVVGANGAGKTTLLRALSGIVAPTGGEIRYDGELFRRDRMDLRRQFFLLPDFPEVFPYMTVLQHIGMVVQLYQAERDGIESTILDLLRDYRVLALADAPLSTLSRGELYKAALVALLAVDPELWLFDEPFASGIDPLGIAAFRRHVRAAAKRGRTVLYTTQILELAAGFSDRVCVLFNGQIAGFDSIARLEQTITDDSPLRELLGSRHEESAGD